MTLRAAILGLFVAAPALAQTTNDPLAPIEARDGVIRVGCEFATPSAAQAEGPGFHSHRPV
jgi:hypothetical protein